MSRLSAAFLALALSMTGCGLIDSDVAQLNLRFPKHDFKVDTTDWRLAGAQVPSVSCQQVNCEQSGALFCGGGCSASCNTGSNTCQAAVPITLVNDFDLANEAPEYQKIGNQPVISVSIDDVYFDIGENTLDVITPVLVVFMGPPSVTSPNDSGAQRVGTIPSIGMRETGRKSITFDGDGKAVMSRYMNDFHTPFRVGVSGEVALHAGDPAPSGKLVGSVQANAHVGL